MALFQKCPPSIGLLATEILCKFDTHQPLLDARVRIDFVFAYGERDDDGNLISDALKHHGVRALGICRKLSLKDRAMGRGDAEIAIDNDWWEQASEEQQIALLDHELHHIRVKVDKSGSALSDALGRPLLKLRPHDFQFGWFKVIAARHRESSPECIAAKTIMDDSGQIFWPDIAKA